jgi:hypothetical protein
METIMTNEASILEIEGWLEEAESEESEIELKIIKIKNITDYNPEFEKIDSCRGDILQEINSYKEQLKELKRRKN